MIHRGVRERLEEREKSLSSYAAKSYLSKGRLHPEPPCPVRTAFQRDRDRIIHCKAFRRLKHKTQVFISPLGDHYVTRLTHTLEVSQIARTTARALNLNEDLTEAIALGHDLGHTPFGHIGEEVLNQLYYPDGFRHNEQSLRVVDVLEREGRGLNLCYEVREGILHHSKPREGIQGFEGETLEGQVVRLADSVAYINHDIADAIRAGLLREDDLPTTALSLLGHSPSERINTMVLDIIDSSWEKPVISMSPRVLDTAETLRSFLFERVYQVCAQGEEAEQARQVVRLLYTYLHHHTQRLPEEYNIRCEPLGRRVVDYMAGMTDRFATRLAEEIA